VTPRDLGLWVPEWRNQQWEAIEQAVDAFCAGKRHVAYALQTGSGKSVIAVAVARLLAGAGEVNGRTVILTSTKGLQKQYEEDCGGLGIVNVSGKNSYECFEFGPHNCDESYALCGGTKGNMSCALHGYRKQYLAAIESELVVTNYDYWCRVPALAEGTGLLVMDEAHEADSTVCESMAVAVSDSGIRYLSPGAVLPWPKEQKDGWEYDFAERTLHIVKGIVEELKEVVSRGGMSAMATGAGHRLAMAQRLELGLGRVRKDKNWVSWGGVSAGGRWVKFEPVWAGVYAESVLFQNVPKVLWMSGTLKSKVLALNGVKRDGKEVEYKEWDRVFRWGKCPVIWVKGGAMKYNATKETVERVYGLADEMVETRAVKLDRPGLVQTVSYGRTEEYIAGSKWKDRIITHSSGEVGEAVEKYKEEVRKGRAVVLVSPSIGTGYDFKGALARWQFLMKVPFISTKDPLTEARCERDKGYAMHVTMTEFVQMCGRIDRSEDDWGETIVGDDNVGWFMRQNQGLAPVGFVVKGPVGKLPVAIREGGR